jgi:DNA-directed RNA polymerase specialized sigma24 family protein
MFQNLMLWLMEHPYNPQLGAFSNHLTWGSKAARTKSYRQAAVDGTSSDSYTCRGSDGSGDDAKGRVLEDGRPTPKIPDLGEDLAVEKILETATEAEMEVIFLLIEGRTVKQISGLLNMGESSVRQRVQYARERAGFKRAKAC